jgi:hypothetical protein
VVSLNVEYKTTERSFIMTEVTKDQAAPKKFIAKRIASVTVELLKIKTGVEYFVKFTGPIHLGAAMPDEVTVNKETGEVKTTPRQPAHVAYVVDLENMAPRQIVVSSVMASELDRSFPNAGYVGLCFAFTIRKIEGKQYNGVTIDQIEEPDGVPAMIVAAPTAPISEAQGAAIADEKAEVVKETAKVDPKKK